MASPNRVLASNLVYWLITEVLSLYLPTAIVLVSIITISWRVSRIKQKAHKVTVTLLTVLSAYLACFSVYFIFTVLTISEILFQLPVSGQLYFQNYAFLILTGHSAVNPIIYAFKARQFRSEIKHLENRALLKCFSLVMKLKDTSPPVLPKTERESLPELRQGSLGKCQDFQLYDCGEKDGDA